MESAQLMGQVNIFRPPSSPTAENGLSISTSNVQIEKHQIFTIEEVSFAIGLNRGSGKNLLIQLAHHTDANEITGDFSSIRGIKRIELAFLESATSGIKSQSAAGRGGIGFCFVFNDRPIRSTNPQSR